jgi:hypothetical protein
MLGYVVRKTPDHISVCCPSLVFSLPPSGFYSPLARCLGWLGVSALNLQPVLFTVCGGDRTHAVVGGWAG